MSEFILQIVDLHVAVDGKEILKGLNLSIELGKINALMGPNGSGKSTLANTLMGHPKYTVTSGQILFKGVDITNMTADERAKLGLFLSFQYPNEIAGLSITSFLRTAYNSVHDDKKLSVVEFRKLLEQKMQLLQMDKKFLERSLNEGFSGGEKKRSEILQLLTLNPMLAILDETDSGLDIDALRSVSSGVNTFMDNASSNVSDKCILIITHYKRILEYIQPDKLFILIDGKIALSGDGKLVDELESKGYGWITQEFDSRKIN
jgi:Fe-S cluster assembly ATP-binding protein